MGEGSKPISEDDYRVIAENVPIVSVDLLVHHQSGIVLGKRQNEPAKDEWFVPGGTVLKGESRIQALHRIAKEELGVDVVVDEILGTYEHFYESAATPNVNSKQYLATAYVVTPKFGSLESDSQHEALRVFTDPFPELHDYVARYLRDLRVEGYQY